MAKSPAFLFYDGDAARDVSHMNRLERGCYFDIIQAQKKFGKLTIEQIKKVLGRDFDDCWQSIEVVLKQSEGLYFIEWLNESLVKREKQSEHQKINADKRWDYHRKAKSMPTQCHGIADAMPLENENEKEKGNEKESEWGCKGETKNETASFAKSCEALAAFLQSYPSYPSANKHLVESGIHSALREGATANKLAVTAAEYKKFIDETSCRMQSPENWLRDRGYTVNWLERIAVWKTEPKQKSEPNPALKMGYMREL